MVGLAAIRQALRFQFHLTYADIAWITGVSERTAWNHCNATPSSKLRHWYNRKPAEQTEAIRQAEAKALAFVEQCERHDFGTAHFTKALEKANLI